MTPSVSPSATGPVPALAGNDWNSVQYQLRTGPRNSMASSSTIYISSQERKCQYLKHRQFGRGEERGDDGGTEDGRTVLSWSPRKYQRRLRCRRKSRLNKTGSGPGHPVAGKILRARIGASAIRSLEYFPFGRAQHDRRGKAGSERRKACFHPGGSGFHLPRGAGGQGHSQFYSIDFHVTHRFFVSFLVRPALLPCGKRGFRAAICKIARPQPPAAAL